MNGADEPLLLTRERRLRDDSDRARIRAGATSLVVGTLLLGAKYSAYQLTGSMAILSDALESIINVVGALFALGGVVIGGRPADRNHPYGHGKIEFFSAAIEGGMIIFAAVLIIKEAGEALLFGHRVQEIGIGLAITLGAGLINAALGLYLVRAGTRHRSVALIADGRHVLSDFWTSVATVIGLGLVMLTGQVWLDAAAGALVGLNLIWTGVGLVRHAAGGLLDQEEPALLERILEAVNANLVPGVIRLHSLRAVRSGRFTHVDASIVVPEFWTVDEAYDFAAAFERRVIRSLGIPGELALQVEPCRRQFCASCEVEPCPIRIQPFVSRSWIRMAEAVRPGAGGQ